MPPCLALSIIMYGSRVSGAIGKEVAPTHTHLGVVAQEKGAFRSPLTIVSQLTIYIYIYIYIVPGIQEFNPCADKIML